ncbi:MAG: hypothetical protein ACPGVO_20500 [Spirulinaceae cyanobacterium]
MNQAILLTTLGCSGSLAATLLLNQPAIAAPDAPQDLQAALTGNDNLAIAQVQSDCLGTATMGYTSDDSLSDALGCACTLCNVNRERTTTPPIQ